MHITALGILVLDGPAVAATAVEIRIKTAKPAFLLS